MDSFEVNKIAGAVLGVLLFAMGANVLSSILFAPKKAGEMGYALPEPEPQAGAAAAAGRGAVRAAAGAPRQGRSGQGPGRGQEMPGLPHLREGRRQQGRPEPLRRRRRPEGACAGFNYSAALKGKGGEWSFEELDKFIHNPKGYIPGTIMAFAGVPSANERADILAYLRTLSDNPGPAAGAVKREERSTFSVRRERATRPVRRTAPPQVPFVQAARRRRPSTTTMAGVMMNARMKSPFMSSSFRGSVSQSNVELGRDKPTCQPEREFPASDLRSGIRSHCREAGEWGCDPDREA